MYVRRRNDVPDKWTNREGGKYDDEVPRWWSSFHRYSGDVDWPATYPTGGEKWTNRNQWRSYNKRIYQPRGQGCVDGRKDRVDPSSSSFNACRSSFNYNRLSYDNYSRSSYDNYSRSSYVNYNRSSYDNYNRIRTEKSSRGGPCYQMKPRSKMPMASSYDDDGCYPRIPLNYPLPRMTQYHGSFRYDPRYTYVFYPSRGDSYEPTSAWRKYSGYWPDVYRAKTSSSSSSFTRWKQERRPDCSPQEGYPKNGSKGVKTCDYYPVGQRSVSGRWPNVPPKKRKGNYFWKAETYRGFPKQPVRRDRPECLKKKFGWDINCRQWSSHENRNQVEILEDGNQRKPTEIVVENDPDNQEKLAIFEAEKPLERRKKSKNLNNTDRHQPTAHYHRGGAVRKTSDIVKNSSGGVQPKRNVSLPDRIIQTTDAEHKNGSMVVDFVLQSTKEEKEMDKKNSSPERREKATENRECPSINSADVNNYPEFAEENSISLLFLECSFEFDYTVNSELRAEAPSWVSNGTVVIEAE